MRNNALRLLLAVALVVLLPACTVYPRGEATERAAATEAGKPYERPVEQRTIPVLAPDAGPDDLVRYTLLANAQVEQSYWAWRAALEQIPQEGTTKATAAITLNSMIDHGASSWEMNSLGVGNDPMADIEGPGKLSAAARRALEEARAAGSRFDKARFALRQKVLTAYYDYALTAEELRLAETDAGLLALARNSIEFRISSQGAPQRDMLKISNEIEISTNNIANIRSRLSAGLAALNALLNRDPGAILQPPAQLPAARLPGVSDEELLARAARFNPELRALADEIAGKKDAIQLAKLQYVPDFSINLTGDLAGAAQDIVGSLTVPALRYNAIEAGIFQAQADLRAAEAQRRQYAADVRAEVVIDLLLIRDAQRQAAVLQKSIIPRAEAIVESTRTSYSDGRASLLDMFDAQRSVLALRRLLAELRMTREKHLADLEMIIAAPL
jgi:outer membrane protein TolC